MERSSIHVSSATRKRLARYKIAGASYDEVLTIFMDAIGPQEFRSRWASAKVDAAKQVVEARAGHRSTGMEAAFRLFELGRGDV